MAIRIDKSGKLREPVRTEEGFRIYDAFVTRAGVFEYLNPDGTIRKEWRPPEEVRRADWRR